jgi:hypothetical protein
MIPKIIWQTHEWEYNDLPDNFKKAAMTWQNLNPTWEYRYVDASQRAKQVEAFSEELYVYYPIMNKPTQADIWRYIVVYENGGAYADMDSVCSTPLDFILNSVPEDIELAGPGPDHNNIIYNANFFAVKNSYLLKQTLENIVNENRGIDLYSIIFASRSNGGMSISDAATFQLHNGISQYTSTLEANMDRVWPNYNGFIHTGSIKEEDWHPNYEVNYYGKPQNYLDLAKENSWSIV